MLPAGVADKLYVAVDGTAVPSVPAATAGRPGKSPDGRTQTREAKLGVVFTQSKLEDDGHPVRDPGSSSYVATMEPVATFASLIDAEAVRRGSAKARQVIVVGDGAAWIWNLAATHFPEATHVVDLYHARQHLHDLGAIVRRTSKRTRPRGWQNASPSSTEATSSPWPPRRATFPFPTPKLSRSKRPSTTSRPTPHECATPNSANNTSSSAQAPSKRDADPSSHND